ncbi:MAG: IS200/IS605 family transposase [Desulfobacterales bacterium]|nr:IS200/IS605 family transposase [Desulfobacterales bacterium]
MSYTCLNYHIVFSTKERKPYLNEEQVQAVCQYIGGILRNQKGCLLTANGMPDHLHLAASLHPQTCLSDCLREIKASSSKWIHETYPDLELFSWQDGYSAFSVSYSGVDKVIAYIRNQQEHHRKITFEEELISLLKKHKIDYDLKYVLG